MPASIPASPSASSSAPTSAQTVSLIPTGLGKNGLTSPVGEDVFSRFLGSLISSGLSANTHAGTDTPATKFGRSGFSLDSALLVLPQELASLSHEDLQALLAQNTSGTDGKLNNQILIALTPGTPAADALKNLLAQQDKAAATMASAASAVATADNPLTISQQNALAADNALLVATDLTPADIDKLKDALKLIDDQKIADQNLKTHQDETDATAAAEAAAASVILVVFVPRPSTQDLARDLSAFSGSGLDITAFSSLTSLNSHIDQPSGPTDTSNSDNPLDMSTQTGSDLQGGLFSLSKGTTPLNGNIPPSSSSQDFKGSLASMEGFKAAEKAKTDKANAADMDSQLPAFSTQLLTTAGTSQSALNDSSLLMTNGAAISTNTSALTNPVTNNPSAYGAHPTIQMVAMMIEKAASGSDKAKQELSVQLDPPELGRLQIQLSYEKGEPMKVHLLAEKQDTLSLLQRDSHALKAALDQAGVQMDGSSLSFDLASGDQSFNQLLGGSQDQNGRRDHSGFSLNGGDSMTLDTSAHVIDTRMDFIPDMATGNIHYSLLV